jgi:tRNA1Val (adenine37-N6)-methyltransferase
MDSWNCAPQVNDDETLDAIFDGKIQVIQKRNGYRFSMDAVILARFAEAQSGESVVELGTGCGVIPLILAFSTTGVEITGLEMQPELVDLAQRNVELNGLGSCVRILEIDFRRVRERLSAEAFSVAVANPPFGTPGSGRINPNHQRAAARHEILATLSDVLDAAVYLVRFGGRLYLIYPVSRLPELIVGLKQRKFEPKLLRMVHTNRRSQAQLVLIKAVKGGGQELIVLPPLYVYTRTGDYTSDMKKLYRL